MPPPTSGAPGRKRQRQGDGEAAPRKQSKGSNIRSIGKFGAGSSRQRRNPLDEDVLLDGGSDDGHDFEGQDEQERDGGDEELVSPDDLETADEKRLRIAKDLLQKLVRDASKQGMKRVSGTGGANDMDDDGDVDEEEDEEETEEEARGITRSGTFDAVAEHLRARTLKSAGGLIQPLASVLASHVFRPRDVITRKGHELPATCIAVSTDGRFVYTGSKDCSIVRWRVNAVRWDEARESPSSSSPAAGDAVDPSEVIIRDATYPGRRRTKDDVVKQKQRVKAGNNRGKGMLPVYGAGFGGGVLGPTAGAGVSSTGDGSATTSAPRIIHAAGSSTIIIPGVRKEEGKEKGDGEMSRSSKAALMARLRGLPDYGFAGHHGEILALAVSSDGTLLASGGRDKVVRLWEAQAPYVLPGASASGSKAGTGADASSHGSAAVPALVARQANRPLGIANLENFIGHKDAVTSLVWRPGSHDLVSGGADRLVKMWSGDERSHVDTLFGHQADITAIDMPPSGKERAVTVGRDRTAQMFKIPEATRLVFRGFTHDASLEAVRVINDSYFVTGSQDGSLSLWHVSRKKPNVTVMLAHGTGLHTPVSHEHAPASVLAAATARKGDGGGAASVLPAGLLARSEDADGMASAATRDTLDAIAEVTGADPEGLSSGYCNWITALAVMPNSDVVASGSGDGFIRLWRLARSQPRGGAGPGAAQRAVSSSSARFIGLQLIASIPVQGIINGLAFSGDGAMLAAAVGTEHRLGRWWRYSKAKNGPLLIRLPRIGS